MMKQQNNQMKGLVWLLVAAVCVPCMLSWAATSSWRAPLGVAAVDTVVQQDGDDDLFQAPTLWAPFPETVSMTP